MRRLLLLWLTFHLSLITFHSPAQTRRAVGPPINRPEFTEYAPSLSANGKTMIFETDRGPNGRWELYFSVKNDKGKWQPPKPITKVNEKGKDNDLIGGPSISYDGQTLYFFASFEGGKGDMDLYYCTREGDDWSAPKPVPGAVNSERYEGFPSISPDGKKLYFIRDNFVKRKDKEICYSIWVATRQDNGDWGTPEKLPAPINLGCEKSPRIMADGRTLIFSSIRPGGVGSFDLWQSFQEDDGSWTAPVNLAYINTEEADQFASVSAAGDLMYYQHTGDIFTVTIPEKYRQYKLLTLDGKVLNAATKQPVTATVTARSGNPKEKAIVATATADGSLSMVLRVGGKYTLTSTNPGFYPFSQPLDLTTAREGDDLDRTLALMPNPLPYQFEGFDKDAKEPRPALKALAVKVMDMETKKLLDVKPDGDRVTVLLDPGKTYKVGIQAPNYSFFVRPLVADTADVGRGRLLRKVPLAALKKDATVVLENITFETGSAALKPDSFEELDRVVDLLTTSPDVKLEISAHTDDVGGTDANLKLSDKRAQSVVKYLTDKKIPANRLIAKGYGESKPLVPNDSDDNRAKNRRVQFTVK
jgi:outer membrane protein OmpA-like peptidoglycan-associated protein